MLIATAMRPHEGVAQSLAHRTIATSVISHTITFHEPCPAGDWFLLSLESPFAGGGRSYGGGHVARRDGRLVASFTQDNMIRAMPAPPPDRKSDVSCKTGSVRVDLDGRRHYTKQNTERAK